MKGSKDNITIRSLVAVVVVLGLTILILHFTNRFYNDPICQRYADSRQLTFVKSTMGWVKKNWPAECFFRDKQKNIKRVEVATLSLTSADWVRWVLSWVATLGGVGGSVWLASVISSDKPERRRR